MKAEKLLDAIGMLPNDLIAQTDTLRSRPRKPALTRHRWAMAAACLVLVLAAGLLGMQLGMLSGKGGASEAAVELQQEMAPAAMNSLVREAPTEDAAPQAAQSEKAVPQESPAEDAVPRAEAEEEPCAPASGFHPLTLTVTWKDGSITAEAGSYTLRETLPDGSESEALACGPHPLQVNAEPAAVSEEMVLLNWAITPDRVTVRCWRADADVSEEGYSFSVLGVRTGMPVFAEYQVYEITAEWEDTCIASYTVHLNYEPEQ